MLSSYLKRIIRKFGFKKEGKKKKERKTKAKKKKKTKIINTNIVANKEKLLNCKKGTK